MKMFFCFAHIFEIVKDKPTTAKLVALFKRSSSLDIKKYCVYLTLKEIKTKNITGRTCIKQIDNIRGDTLHLRAELSV